MYLLIRVTFCYIVWRLFHFFYTFHNNFELYSVRNYVVKDLPTTIFPNAFYIKRDYEISGNLLRCSQKISMKIYNRNPDLPTSIDFGLR